MSAMGQKRPKLPWLPAAKSATEQRVKFVPKEDLPVRLRETVPPATAVAFDQSRPIEPRGGGDPPDLSVRWK